MAQLAIFYLLGLGLLATSWPGANGQLSREVGLAKPGVCPPPRGTSICRVRCQSDMDCYGSNKCCPTSCGTLCASPLSQMQPKIEKEGLCPAVPEGPWVCTSRCSQDSDCRRNLKCCRNRCGALACQPPQLD